MNLTNPPSSAPIADVQPVRVALITGAGSGIGRACAVALSRAGYAVALTGRRVDALVETATQCGTDAAVLAWPADVTQEADVQALFDAVVARWGRLDVLFNNAGIGAPAVSPDALSLADWQRVVDVNLTGMFLCLRQAFRVMKAQQPRGGRIINNGSISAHTPRPHTIAYTATKHAVTGLTKSAALDGRAFDIAVGQIDIGNAATAMTERMAAGILQPNGQIMAEAVMDVGVVADSVVYMASLPIQANVLFHTVMATGMPFVGRG